MKFNLISLSFILCFCLNAQKYKDWKKIFNGKNLENWTVKIYHHEVGDNYSETFRVKNKTIQVNYNDYSSFNNRFGHLFYDIPMSYYRLKLAYKFTDRWLTDAPEYTKLNSGVMFHAQDPRTILKEQDWPVSVEMQFLADLEDGNPRPTGNMCSPGTEIEYKGTRYLGHCLNSNAGTFKKGQWVLAELEVLGDSLVRHKINGKTVLEYTKPSIGGGVANGFDKDVIKSGTALKSGYFALQSEGQEIEFKDIKVLNLEGCMNPKAKNFRDYYIKNNPSACQY